MEIYVYKPNKKIMKDVFRYVKLTEQMYVV